MPDVELDDLGHAGNRLRRQVIEAVAGMDFEPEAVGEGRALADTVEFRRGLVTLMAQDRLAPGAGVNLDHRHAEPGRHFDLSRLRSYEERHPDGGATQLRDQ